MRRNWLVVIVLLCTFILTTCGPTSTVIPSVEPSTLPTPTPAPQLQETEPVERPARHHEPDGGFSYVPPPGWRVTDPATSLPYKVVVGPETDGFSPNINVVDEAFAGTLDEYVTTSLGNMQSFFDGFRLISQDLFKPDEGPAGAALVVENVQSGRSLRQIFFMFDVGPKKVVLTCTRLAGAGRELDATFEQVARTFRIEPE